MHAEQVTLGLRYIQRFFETCTQSNLQRGFQDIEIRFENNGRRMISAKEQTLYPRTEKRNQKASIRT